MAMSFRYKSVRAPDGEMTKCPLSPVTLHGDSEFSTTALLDSGADVSAVPVSVAEALGLNLSGEKGVSHSIGGRVQSIHSRMTISIQKAHERYRFTIPVLVVLGKYDFPLLLGRRGFFEKFKITFDEQNERFSLKRVTA